MSGMGVKPKAKRNDIGASKSSQESVTTSVTQQAPKISKIQKTEEDTESLGTYNPFEHRNVQKPTSDLDSLAHLLKVSLGTGVLAMPMGVKHAGLVLGSIGSILIGILCTYCIQMLVRSSQVLCKRVRVPTLDYASTVEKAFTTGPPRIRKCSKFMKYLINIELILSFLMGNTVYVLFISETIKQIVDYYTNAGIVLRYYILMLWVPLSLICMVRTLKSLVPFSVMADILMFTSISITLYYIFREINPPNSVKLVANWVEWPEFMCTVVFALEGIGAVLPIENEMKNPEHFIGGKCGIVYVSMSIATILYVVFGFFGYLQYGDEVEGSITLNLPVSDVLAQVTKLMIGVTVFFTYALQYYVPINLIWVMIKDRFQNKYHRPLNILLRVSLVTFTIVAALILPDLEPVISLVGSVCFSTLGLTFPCLLDTVTRWPYMGRLKWRLITNTFIFVLSLITLISGTISSITDIVQKYG